MTYDVEAINLEERLVLLSDATIVPINMMIDINGDGTEEPEEAVALVAGPDVRDRWWSIDCNEFEVVNLN